MKKGLVIFTTLLTILLIMEGGNSQTLNDCANITVSGTYELTGNITDTSFQTCINITVDNVIFDCKGYYLLSASSSAKYAIAPYGIRNNITIKNCSMEDFENGIYTDTANKLNNSVIRDLTVRNTTGTGLILTGNFNTIENIVVNNTGLYGITISGDNSTITNVNVSYASYSGFHLTDAENGTYSQCNSFNNQDGIDFGITTYYNKFTSCNFYSNTRYGINGGATNTFNKCNISYNPTGVYLSGSLNKFFNNWFNNSLNVNTTTKTADWNTTLQNGERVYGQGVKIGGNAWNNYTSSFYESCTDSDRDGICDNSYTINGTNIDYLPLSDEGNYITECSTISKSGNYYLNNSVSSNAWVCMSISATDIIFDCQNNEINGINYNGEDYGFYISSNQNVTLKNCVVKGYYYGIYIDGTDNATVENNTVTNETFGIVIAFNTFNMTVTNSNISYNTQDADGFGGIGIYDIGGGLSNGAGHVIKDNHFVENEDYPISLDSENGSIYNNFFNNTKSLFISGNINLNVTQQSGTRIYGNGTEIGGNFWAKPDGSGFSETCTNANSDGFCDSSYQAYTGFYDYLPLAETQDSSTTLYFNGSNSDISVYQGDTVNITVCSNITGMNKTIYIDGILETYSNTGKCLTLLKTTSSMASGNHNVTGYSEADYYHYQSSNELTLTVTTTETPTYSDIEGLSQTYSFSDNYQFNITWKWNNTPLDTVIININGINYTVTTYASVGTNKSEYYFERNIGLDAGSYTLYWWANNTAGLSTQTTDQTLTISKATPSLSLSSSAGWSITVGQQTIITGTETNNGDDDVNYTLTFDGSTVSNPYTFTSSETGSKLVTYSASSGTNYSSSSISTYLFIYQTAAGGGGGGDETVKGNWTFLVNTAEQWITAGSDITFTLTIINNLEEDMKTINVECVPDEKADLCKFITFPKTKYKSGYNYVIELDTIKKGQRGFTKVTINMTKEYMERHGLEKPESGDYKLSLIYDYKGKKNTVFVLVKVVPLPEKISDFITWLSEDSEIFENAYVPNSVLLASSIMFFISVIFIIIMSGGKRKRRRR